MEVKQQLQDMLNGMPVNKQVLQVESSGAYLKDKNSLAFFNLQSGVEVQLSVKTRGRR